MSMKLFGFIFLSLVSSQIFACNAWFQKLKIQDHKNCEDICRTSPTDMSSFTCKDKCKSLCKNHNSSDINQNFYGLTDDESDACRHYVWSILLNRTIGDTNAEKVLNAHESNTKELTEERAMDLANNRLGLLNYQKIGKNLTSDEEILKSFREQLSENKFIILKPNYKSSGGLP